MTAVAADVPGKYDLVLNSQGYRFYDAEEPRALYSFSPTFVQRTNVEGDYGDNQQDFWLTWTQRDWSRGEQLKFYRDTSGGRYWKGSSIDVRTAGQVTLRQAVKTVTFGSTVRAAVTALAGAVNLAGTTNLFTIDQAGATLDKGAHGLGAAPASRGIAFDSHDLYLSTTAAGTVGVRKWDGAAFTTFSASPADVLAFNNNSLYGIRNDNSKLVRWSTAGVQSDVFQWLDADGGVRAGAWTRLIPMGGRLIATISATGGIEIWQYDGTGVNLLATLPSNFNINDLAEAYGVLFIGGTFVKPADGSATTFFQRPGIFYYASGTLGLLWQADTYTTSAASAVTATCALATYDGGIIFNDDINGKIMHYEPASGGVHSLGSFTVAGDTPILAANSRILVHTRNQTTTYVYPDSASVATSGTVTSALVDFDSSLPKHFKAVIVDADIPTGATVDIAYRTNDLDGSYTTIQSGATAGTEYTIGQTARSISVQITLNKGSSAAGPTLKRVYLRAAPIEQAFRLRQYVLNLTGNGAATPVRLNDGTPHPKSGHDMAADLITAAGLTTPFSITDRFGTFTGLIEPNGLEIREIGAGQNTPGNSGEFVATVKVREV